MAKKRTKTDFTEQIERQKQFRVYLARKEEAKKKREQGAAEQKES
jgi:ribosomal protein L35